MQILVEGASDGDVSNVGNALLRFAKDKVGNFGDVGNVGHVGVDSQADLAASIELMSAIRLKAQVLAMRLSECR